MNIFVFFDAFDECFLISAKTETFFDGVSLPLPKESRRKFEKFVTNKIELDDANSTVKNLNGDDRKKYIDEFRKCVADQMNEFVAQFKYDFPEECI